MVWKRDATTGLWKRNQLFLSMHSGYDESAWENVENTFDEADVEESGGKDKDLVKIYPGWAKHPNFMKRETGWRDTVSQGCQREYRSNNWKVSGDIIG